MNRMLLIMIVPFLFSGCIKEVSPWEKETLGSDSMKKHSGNDLMSVYEEHIYYSKEGSKGGSGVSGGGCGCN